jgi:hypothetical protein
MSPASNPHGMALHKVHLLYEPGYVTPSVGNIVDMFEFPTAV